MYGLTNLLALSVLGLAMLWMLRLVYNNRGDRGDDLMRRVLTLAAWILFLFGIFGGSAGLLLVFSPLGWAVIIAIVLMTLNRHRKAETRVLLTMLAAAAERSLPLPAVARAYAVERGDEMGERAGRLADLLESGVPLRAALAGARHPLSVDARLGVDLGMEMGLMAQSLRWVNVQADLLDTMVRAWFEKVFYLLVILAFGASVLAFVMVKIVPVVDKLLNEFGLTPPAVTQSLIHVSDWLVSYWYLTVPLQLFLGLLLFLGFLHYVGWLPADMPGLHWIGRRIDAARIQRTLAMAVSQQRPLLETLSLLQRIYPKHAVRRKLDKAFVQMAAGGDWCDSLCSAGILSRADAGVLQAAQSAGNLQWALEEMADSNVRRLNYRLRGLLSVCFPLLLLAFGLVVLVVAVAIFLPLLDIVYGQIT